MDITRLTHLRRKWPLAADARIALRRCVAPRWRVQAAYRVGSGPFASLQGPPDGAVRFEIPAPCTGHQPALRRGNLDLESASGAPHEPPESDPG